MHLLIRSDLSSQRPRRLPNKFTGCGRWFRESHQMALVYVYNETKMSWEKMKPDHKGLLLQIFVEPQLAWAGFELSIYTLNQIGVFSCLLVLPGTEKNGRKGRNEDRSSTGMCSVCCHIFDFCGSANLRGRSDLYFQSAVMLSSFWAGVRS